MGDETAVIAELRNGVSVKAKSGPRGFGRKYLYGQVVWVEFWFRGKQYRESTRKTGRAGNRAADKLLKAVAGDRAGPVCRPDRRPRASHRPARCRQSRLRNK